MQRTEKSGPGGGRIPAGSMRSGEKGSTTGAAAASTKNLFGGDLYCMKDLFGATLYTRRPPFGGSYYWEVNSVMIYG